MRHAKLLGLIFCLGFGISAAYPQNPETALQAKVSIIQNVIGPGEKQIAVIAVSFVNTSDVDLYIPDIVRLKNEAGFPRQIQVYSKNDGYKPVKFFGGFPLPAPIDFKNLPLNTMPPNVFPGIYTNRIQNDYRYKNIDRIAKIRKRACILVKAAHLDVDTTRLFTLPSQALFIKAHEEVESYFSTSIDLDLMVKADEYKITYEPKIVFENTENLPDQLLTYHKFLPTKIPANVVYLKTVYLNLLKEID